MKTGMPGAGEPWTSTDVTLRSKWNSSSPYQVVLQYAREQGFTKSAYEKAYAKGALPQGFPACPGQQWPETWSWRAVRDEFPVSRMIWDYPRARKLVQKWQLRTGRRLTNGPTFETARECSRILRRIPKQPDNPKSGGLNGWPKKSGWDDFLGCTTQRDAEIHTAREAQLIDEMASKNAPEVAAILVQEGLDRASKVQSYRKLYRELYARADWREILDRCAGRSRLLKDPAEIVEILAAHRVFSEAGFQRKRRDDQDLQRIPHHLQRIGRDLFERAKAICGMPNKKER
jgi:hypothetical protein